MNIWSQIVKAIGNASWKVVVVCLALATGLTAALAEIVNPGEGVVTTAVITVNPNPAYGGEDVTITANVTAIAGTPAGEVKFFRDCANLSVCNGEQQIGTATLGGGAASITTKLTASYDGTLGSTVNPYKIKAIYVGDTAYAPSESTQIDVNVRRSPTTLIVTSSQSSTFSGQPITFTAQVTATSGYNAFECSSLNSYNFNILFTCGYIEFFDGSVSLGGVQTDVNGRATLTTSALSVGSHMITAVFSRVRNPGTNVAPINPGLGTAEHLPSVSAGVTHTVNNDPRITIGVNAAPSPAFGGEDVTLTATVAATTGTPTGEVKFFRDCANTSVCNGEQQIGVATLSGGTASITTKLTASYDGTLGSTVNPYKIKAQYHGDATFGGSDTVIEMNARRSPTTVTITSSQGSTLSGQPVTFTAQVTATSGYNVFECSSLNAYGFNILFTCGYIEFFDGNTSLGGFQTDINGRASLTTSALSVGSHTITAVFSRVQNPGTNVGPISPGLGTAEHLPSVSTGISHTVNSDSRITVGVNATPSSVYGGEEVTVTATVTATTGTPTGEVKFYRDCSNTSVCNGERQIGTATLSGGTASINTKLTASFDGTLGSTVNPYKIKAIYVGDSSLGPQESSQSLVQVRRSPTETTLKADRNTSVLGQPITFTAQVTATSGYNVFECSSLNAYGFNILFTCGYIEFFDGTVSLGGFQTDVNGRATLTTSALSVGSHTITAVFSRVRNPGTNIAPISRGLGTAEHLPSVSTGLVVDVDDAIVTLASSKNPSNFGENVTFTATLQGNRGTPTGTVTFRDGTTDLATVPISSGVATYSTAALTAGTHQIQAFYSGDSTYGPKVSLPLAQVVNLTNLTVNPSTLPGGTVGVDYDVTITAIDGTAPYAFTTSAGTMPPGLVLESGGRLHGRPTTAGTFTFTVKATDAASREGTRNYTVVINAPAISITPATLPDGTRGFAYSQQISANGGTTPYTFSLDAGTLPPGITLAPNGSLSGTPTQLGDFNITIKVTDSSSGPSPFSATKAYVLRINPAIITVTPTVLPGVLAGVQYAQNMAASGGVAPYTFTLESGSLPNGLSLTGSTGRISGAANEWGLFEFVIRATDAFGNTGVANVSLTVQTRPDPSLDKDIQAYIDHEDNFVQRFARAQLFNVGKRFEALHAGTRGNGNYLTLNAPGDDSAKTLLSGPGIDGSSDDDDASGFGPLSAMIDNAAEATSTGAVPDAAKFEFNEGSTRKVGSVEVWYGGTLGVGKREELSNASKYDFTTTGLSAGVDMKVSDRLVAGIGGGYGRQKTDIGYLGSKATADNWVAMAYASYAATPKVFIDAAVGGGSVDFSFHRFDKSALTFADGEREGWMTFSSLGTSYQATMSKLHLSGYGRLDYSLSELGAFTEEGAGIFNLFFEERRVESFTSALGVKVNMDKIDLMGVKFTSSGNIEWVHEFMDGNIEYIQYADWLNGPVYQLEANGLRRDFVEAQLGMDMELGDDWSASADFMGRTNSVEKMGSMRIEITKAF